MFYKSLRKEKFSPGNLSDIENLRWEYVIKRQEEIKKNWAPLFKQEKCFYGTSNLSRYPQGAKILFEVSDHGISYSLPKEGDLNANNFIRCLPDNKVPLYINSEFVSVRDAVKNRLEGKERYAPIPERQDLVDRYFRHEVVNSRMLKIIGYCDIIIHEHFDNLLSRVEYSAIEHPLLILTINGRVYMCKDRMFTMTPESKKHFFWEEDLFNDKKEDKSRIGRYQIKVT